ncbi:MAG: hypothetical protein AB1918_03190 [Pseudomonadota bacterium]
MTVIPFPASQSRADRIRGIEACLDYLRADAQALNLPMLAHFIGVAREAAREAVDEDAAK